jgi:hypothetical protein
MRGQASRTRGHRAALQVLCDQRGALLVHERAGQPARLVAHLEVIAQVMELVGRPLVQRSVGLYRLYRLYRLSSARYGARLYSAPSDGFTTIPVRRLHNHPCPTEHAHRVVHVRTAAGTRAAAEGGANGQCMPLPLLAHAQAEGQGRPAVAHNASFWRSTRLRLSSFAAGA